MKSVYMDYAATTPTDPDVVKAMLPYFSERYGNPSSLHAFGQSAKHAVEESREAVAALIGAKAEEVVFTSGGTESNNFALKGTAWAMKSRGNHIITSAIEHHAVSEPLAFLEKEGFRITRIPVDPLGMVDPADVEAAITDETILISVMHGNNEIGTIQPISAIGNMARERNIPFHSDAVQTVGHLPIRVDNLHVDLLSASGHKFYGPKGVGFLYIRKGTRIQPFLHGGEQERGRRASTLNVPAIVGMGKAAALAGERMPEDETRIGALRDRMIAAILEKVDNSRLNGHPSLRLANNVNISFEFVEGESLLLNLDMVGVACSTGSACASTTVEPSHVLSAIGLSHALAHGSLRFTLGRHTTPADVDYVLDILPSIVNKLRAVSPAYRKHHE
ncbi:MAG: Cysteine desulfurase IscS [Syntrophus sp. SKADARSKE-3]|nr:Cysteine desulfurase IscS [Syntrophus sp. SKADARSKE-3]